MDGSTSVAMSDLAERVHANRRRIRDLLAEADVCDARLFGSVARGDDRSDSDIDLLIELPIPYDGMRYVRLLLALEDLLGCAVDLIPVDTLPPIVRQRAEREAIPI